MLAAMLAGPASAQDAGWTSNETLQQLALDAHRACSAPDADPPNVQYGLMGHAGWLAGLEERADTPCTPRPRLALRIARAVADSRGANAALGHRLLSQLYERGIGVPRSPEEAQRHGRIAWLLIYPGSLDRPFGSTAEMEDYLARPETIALLRRYADVPDMPFVRLRLGRALLARGGRNAANEARALLAGGDGVRFPEATFLLQRATYEWGTATEQALALGHLRSAARHAHDGGESRDYVAAIALRMLAGSSSVEESREAIAMLADAAFAPDSPHRPAFLEAVAAANGGVPPATLTGEAAAAARRRLRLTISADDYPAGALRGEEEGAVVLRGLLDPDGWLIYNEPAVGGQPRSLVAYVRGLYARRRLPPVDRSGHAATPYVWVPLPVVLFSLSE
jgi:hypothetical protein